MTHETYDGIDLFGQSSLGYVVIESRRLADWRRFLDAGIGMHCAHAEPSLLAFRMDAHARRLLVLEGPAEDIVTLGWQLQDAAALQALLARLARHDIAVKTGTGDEAAQRGVREFHRIRGPKDIALEFFVEALTDATAPCMQASGFSTGPCGMGHVAITTRAPERMLSFWQTLLDARISDRIAQPLGGAILEVTFLRVNPRHHTVAIAATRGLRVDPARARVQHLNVEVQTLEDLTSAFSRLNALGFAMAHDVGQHPNDRELSFYAVSPSGFEIEVGWNALQVDETSWQVAQHDAISLWGHRPGKDGPLHRLLLNAGNARRGLLSLLRREHSPL
jgi:2,3-dihydroxybiphenyl 1,2-dioxygenase